MALLSPGRPALARREFAKNGGAGQPRRAAVRTQSSHRESCACSFFTVFLHRAACAFCCAQETKWLSESLAQRGRGIGFAEDLFCIGLSPEDEWNYRGAGRTKPAMSFHPFWLVTAAVYVALLWLYFKVVRRYLK